MAPRSTMLRLFLRFLAVVLVFRVLGELLRHLTSLPRQESRTPLGDPSRGGARAAAKPRVDRTSAIDVPFTEEPREG